MTTPSTPSTPAPPAIVPGARVRSTVTLSGTVERVAPPEAGPRATLGFLVVRTDDGATHYHVPLSCVAGVVEESDHAVVSTVVQLALDPADLDRYAVRDAAAQGTMVPGETLRLPLAAEELVAETRPVQRHETCNRRRSGQ